MNESAILIVSVNSLAISTSN